MSAICLALRWHLPVLALTLATAIPPALAQGEAAVQGEVLATADGSPLTGVAVTLASVGGGEPAWSTTDLRGRFSFTGLRPGEYTISARADGFAPRELRLALDPREIKVVGLSLELRPVELDVQVSAATDPIPSTRSPSSTVLTGQRLGDMPVAARTTFTDAIATLAPGMIRGHDDFVHVRGHEIALNPFIDGVSFWENPHAVFSAGLSPDVIDTANVMTGGFSAEYGNRFGGVVDVVTRSGLRMQHDGSVSVTGGEAGRRSVSAEFGGHRKGFGYFLFGSGFESRRFLSPPDPRAIHDDARGGHAFARLDRDLGPGGALRVVLMGDGTNVEIPKAPRDVEIRPLARPEAQTRQQTSIVGWTRAVSDLAVGASIYQRWSRSRLLPAAGPYTAVARLARELLTGGAKTDVTRLAGRHAFKAGVDAVWLHPEEDLAYEYSGYRDFTHLLGLPHLHVVDNVIFTGRESGGQLAAYVQDAVQLGGSITADLGIRFERYDLVVAATHASPRVNLAFDVGGGAVLHGSYNHFFVPPAVEGVLSNGAGLTRYIREIGFALPPPRPTTEDQFEIGGSAPIGPLRLTATGYYRTTDNPVHTTVWPDSRIYSYASFDRARAYGLEAKAESSALAHHGLTGYANYALGRVDFYNPVTGGFVIEGEHITNTNRFLAPMDQTHTVTAGATYRHSRTGAWIGTAIEYGSGTPIGHAESEHEPGVDEPSDPRVAAGSATPRVPRHFSASLSAGIDLLGRVRQRSRLSLQVDVENLTGHVYRIAQEGEFSPAQFSIPRLVSATAKVRF